LVFVSKIKGVLPSRRIGLWDNTFHPWIKPEVSPSSPFSKKSLLHLQRKRRCEERQEAKKTDVQSARNPIDHQDRAKGISCILLNILGCLVLGSFCRKK
jgi:hypothetical protein